MNPAILKTLKTTGGAAIDVGSAGIDALKSVKSVTVEPVSAALETAVRTDIDDVIPGSLDSLIQGGLDIVGGGSRYRKIKNYSVADMIAATMPEVENVEIIHGRMSRPNNYDPDYRYPQQISIIKGTEHGLDRQNLFTFMQPDDNPYIKGDNPLEWMSVGEIDSPQAHSAGPIYAPFSKFTPTALWPWQTSDGGRMTAAELAETPLEGDWLGTKPIAEAVVGQRLNKVGAIPGYRFVGDLALATPLILSGIVVVASAPIWTPLIGAAATTIAKSVVSLGIGIGRALT